MNENQFQGDSVKSNRVIYTPSTFARTSLVHLQEVGKLQALQSHTSSRQGLNSYLFFVITDGSGELFYNGTHHSVDTGDCVFIDCRQSYSHTPSYSNLWALSWVHFYGSMTRSIYDNYVERGGQPVFHPNNIDRYLSLLSSIHEITKFDDFIRDIILNEKLTSLLTLIMSESWLSENSSQAGLKKQFLQHVKTYLEEHYKERISLDKLSEKFYINKFYLTRIFKEQFGTTIFSYLDHVRVAHAKQLLRFTDMTAEEIGCEVSIDEPGYFTHVFKKVEGMTPNEYRKKWRGPRTACR